ncbi:hypothetical protein DI09_23p80 [Mitosporidium daphniae]|uniref:PI3K/PI4K catalytic domain-containing protein n=1 Tax=Mitosporidium daphniae TaxID=1485682 RepID=A0A098VSA6_9MICR|nr:uncharacterized protein DI09_23p80 [Mitosporidium daphniae]KGG51933.1 hypothetical protein DI09_23p80 [Mitosporidium daphniae]|eukprot:XP_013238387.1 uncharacterized protein DI09_23p80 [Mitosporidium daphniae]
MTKCEWENFQNLTPDWWISQVLFFSDHMQSLLLRLFESDFFNTWIAVSYLYKYLDPGIQEYLCKRLSEQPISEISFLLPQLWFVLPLLIVLWLLESYEADFAEKKIATYIGRISKLKARFHSSLLQNDTESLALTPLPPIGASCPLKISPYSIKSVFVGMGAIAASIVSPQGLEEIRRFSLQQGLSTLFKVDGGSPDRAQGHTNLTQKSMATILKAIAEKINPSWDEFYVGKAFSLQRSLSKLETAFSKVPISTLKSLPRSTTSLERPESRPCLQQDNLSASLPASSSLSNSIADAEENSLPLFFSEPKLCADIQSTHYYHSEMAFISALTEISERLFRIPKSSRQKALQAELSLLNHNLPANVCIPFWCSECLRNSAVPHARILRICPTEAVVLNSAERVPFMILIETESNCTSESPLEADSFSSSSSSDVELLRDNEPSYSMLNSTSACEFYDKMRTAAILLAQLHQMTLTKNLNPATISTIRSRIIKEMELLDLQKLKSSSEASGAASFISVGNDKCQNIVNDLALVKDQMLHEDPSYKMKRVQLSSPFGGRSGWALHSLIVKSSADLRQELLAVQIIKEMLCIWKDSLEPSEEVWLKYSKLPSPVERDSIEPLSENLIHAVDSELQYCILEEGDVNVEVPNYPQSYTLLTYFIKVSLHRGGSITFRHNGNILIDSSGHLIHIDFGFMLSNSPGYVGFESAPFKLLSEWVDILGGAESPLFQYEFRDRFVKAFLALRKHSERILLLVEMMMKDSSLACFYSGADIALYHLRERFVLSYTDAEVVEYVEKLISASYDNIFTKLYDSFQYYSNGIL